MNITKKIMSLAMVVVLSLNGCADLDVTNTNAPDQARALASPEDVESLIKSTFLSFWQMPIPHVGVTMECAKFLLSLVQL